MNTLHFRYHLKLSFDEAIRSHRFTVKCTPQSDERQRIESLKVSVYPEESLSEGRDAFGNLCIFGNADLPHASFEVLAEGIAITGLSDGIKAHSQHQIGMFRVQTKMTKPGPEIEAFYHKLKPALDQLSSREKCHRMMLELHHAFSYVPEVTDLDTTAEMAMKMRQGVCQDYTHILIALCRMAEIPARYVVGMLIGEGYSHAWVEVESEGIWYGYDPTNNRIVSHDHIKISHGRDYTDCLINQGLFTGLVKQTQKISVQVKPLGVYAHDDTHRLRTASGK